MPVGAVGGKKVIMQHLAPTGPVYQAGTLSGNPIAMAAGLACLRPAKELTLLLSCDAPLAARCLPALAGTLIHDGAVAYHEGYRQLLVGLYRTEKLRDAVAPGARDYATSASNVPWPALT